MEHNRQKIATGILREKKQLEDGSMKVDNNPLAGRERFIDLLVGNVENRVLLVHQGNDNKSHSAIFQDASSLVVWTHILNRPLHQIPMSDGDFKLSFHAPWL